MTIYLGTYTEALPHVHGVASGIIVGDYRDGAISGLHSVAARSPSWLVTSATHVYAVAEAGAGDPGQLAVFARTEHSLVHLQSVPSGGLEPAHLALDPTGRFLVLANYADGVLCILELDDDGTVERQVQRVQLEGRSVHPVRQSGPHPHHVLFDPVGGEVLVADLGADAVIRFKFDGGTLTELGRIPLTPGSGPRHAALHPDGERLLVLNELASTVAVFRRSTVGFVAESVVSTLPTGVHVPSFASALAVTAAGDRVYASNRGHDSIAVLDASGRRLELVQIELSRGRTPRDLTLSPDERYLLVANQDSDTIARFERDEMGLLRYVDSVSVPTPACVIVRKL